jgi:F0F1-type ATP synthase alpha subunit
VIYAVTNGYLNDVTIDQVVRWETEFRHYMNSVGAEVLKNLREEKALTDEIVAALKESIQSFNAQWK